jgi:hypothetical protein
MEEVSNIAFRFHLKNLYWFVDAQNATSHGFGSVKDESQVKKYILPLSAQFVQTGE